MPLNEKELALNNILKDNLQMYISMLYIIMIGFGVKWYLSPNSDTIPIFLTIYQDAVSTGGLYNCCNCDVRGNAVFATVQRNIRIDL